MQQLRFVRCCLCTRKSANARSEWQPFLHAHVLVPAAAHAGLCWAPAASLTMHKCCLISSLASVESSSTVLVKPVSASAFTRLCSTLLLLLLLRAGSLSAVGGWLLERLLLLRAASSHSVPPSTHLRCCRGCCRQQGLVQCREAVASRQVRAGVLA